MSVSRSTLRRVEEASLNAWPALNVRLYDGWLLRFASGYTKRANSVTGFYESNLPVDEKINICQEIYRQQRQPLIFRITPFIQPVDLDDRLARRGYQVIDPTRVQLLDLNISKWSIADRVEILPTENGLAAWLRFFHVLNPARRDIQTHQRILEQVTGKMCLMVQRMAGSPAACGLAILDGDFLGLFDIVTSSEQRRKGYGRRITQSLLAWGQDLGAQHAYLQVMVDNFAARQLYARLGFEEIYTYWYRVRPGA